MPTLQGAFLSLVSPAQREDLDRFGHFSTVIPRGARRWSGRQACLLLDDGVIEQIGTLRPGRVAASGLRQLHYQREFDVAPIHTDRIRSLLPRQVRRHFDGALIDEGRLPPATWTATAKALQEIDSDTAKRLESLMRSLVGRGPQLHGHAFQVAAQERDVLRSALDFAGLGREVLCEVEPASGRSIVERLGYAISPEDFAISHDSLRFLNAKAISSPAGIVEFEDGDHRLVVINVNRRSLETTLGADLIYINETSGSFILVQYKTMRDEVAGRPVFRPTADANVNKELARMRAVKPGKDDGKPDSFRLDAQAGYVKLCDPVVALRQYDTKPISGMYLPLPLLDAILRTPEARGPRDGLAIGRHNVARYLTNSQFAELVRDGWIGTRTSSTKELTKIVIDALSDGRSVTVAAASGTNPTRRFGSDARRRRDP